MNKKSEIKDDQTQDKPTSLKVTTSPEIAKGVYSNLAIIRHTQNEFIVDFLFRLNGDTQLVSRVIMSPDHMKLVKEAIEKNILIFEGKKPVSLDSIIGETSLTHKGSLTHKN